MTFREYLNSIEIEDEFDMVIGDEEMPATVIWDKDYQITAYFEALFGEILNSEVKVHEDPTGRYTKSLELIGNAKAGQGRAFTLMMAGYCTEKEFNKLLGENA